MASTAFRQSPSLDYFAFESSKIDSDPPTGTWNSSPATDTTRMSGSYDTVFTSPTSPESSTHPEYSLPHSSSPAIKSEEAFDFGTFEDWMRWDDPETTTLSPTALFFPNLNPEPISPRSSVPKSPDGKTLKTCTIPEQAGIFGKEPIKGVTMVQTTISSSPMNLGSPPEHLYSTPLSWTDPLPGAPHEQPRTHTTSLTPQQIIKLSAIAMPSNPLLSQLPLRYPASPSTTPSSPEEEFNQRKRKTDNGDEHEIDDEEDFGFGSGSGLPRVKKTAHNMIEKRYRTNLNDKIAALKEAVPSLRVVDGKGNDGDVDLQGLSPAHKLNKATVLSKATEYIIHLEKRNHFLLKENEHLKSRVDAFEILVMSRQPMLGQSNNDGVRHQNSFSASRTSIAGHNTMSWAG